MADVVCAEGKVVDFRILARLETLDDVIFEALNGDAEALDQARHFWRDLSGMSVDSLPTELLEESRRQYLRKAEAVCELYRHQPEQTLGKVFAALEIMGILAD